MIVFAAGNKYEVININLVHGCYYVFGKKMTKSSGKFDKPARTFNIGPHYEEIKEEV